MPSPFPGMDGQRQRTFDDIEAVHVLVPSEHPPFLRKVVDIMQITRLTGKKVRLKSQNHVSFIKMIE
jgi:hypothetical protein